jgi:hypothetical protein
MVSHTQPPLPKHSRFHPYGTTRQGIRVGSTCTYRLVIDSALRGNQNKPEITVKDLANDSRESDLERSRKVQLVSCQGGVPNKRCSKCWSLLRHAKITSRTFVDRGRHLQIGEGARVTLPVASILLGFLFAGVWWTLKRELTFKVGERNSILVPSWFAMASSY